MVNAPPPEPDLYLAVEGKRLALEIWAGQCTVNRNILYTAKSPWH